MTRAAPGKAEISGLPARFMRPRYCAADDEMGLVAVLSNPQAEALFQRLTRRDWRQVRRAPRPRDRSRDGKLKFGTVSTAVLAVLAQTDAALRFIEIHARVEGLLAMPVSRSSVKTFLSAESRHRKPRFERVGYGRYKLSDSDK